MNALLKKENLLMIGAGVLAFVAVGYYLKKRNETKSNIGGANPCGAGRMICPEFNNECLTIKDCQHQKDKFARTSRPKGGGVFAVRRRAQR